MSTITGGTPFGGGIFAVTTFTGQRLLLCSHVVERYKERVKPHLSMTEAAQDLSRLLPIGASQLAQAPPWVANAADHKSAYVALGPDVVIAIGRRGRSVMAITCLTRPVRKRSTGQRRHRRRTVRGVVPRQISPPVAALASGA